MRFRRVELELSLVSDKRIMLAKSSSNWKLAAGSLTKAKKKMKKYWKHVRINGDFWLEMHTFFSLASFWHLLMKITYTRHKMKAIAACAKEHSFSEHESLTNIYAKRLPFSHHIVECTDAVILLHTFARQMKLHSGQSHCIAGKCNAESQTKCEETKYLPGIGNKFRNLSSVDKITVRRHSKTHSNGICLFSVC